jgi:hypothetical protein
MSHLSVQTKFDGFFEPASLRFGSPTLLMWVLLVVLIIIPTSSSYIATDGQSASSSWCPTPFGADDQILNLSDNFFLLHVGRPL